jgi:hypothetical protein
MRAAKVARVALTPSTARSGQTLSRWSTAVRLSGQSAPVPRAELAAALRDTTYTPLLPSGTGTPLGTLPTGVKPTDSRRRTTEDDTAEA